MKGIKQYGNVLEGSWRSDDISFSPRALFFKDKDTGREKMEVDGILLMYFSFRIKWEKNVNMRLNVNLWLLL